MHQLRIFRRNTIGQNTRVFIASNVAYTTDATFAAFITNAVNGEVGVFTVLPAHNADVQATRRTTALTATDKFFIAQMQVQSDGTRQVKKTPVCTLGDAQKRREAFCLPVVQVSHVGHNGTDGDIADVVPTVLVGDIYSVSVIETIEGYQPFPTWNYEYQAKAGDTLDDVVDALVADINNTNSITHQQNPPIVTAAKTSAGTGDGGSGNEAGFSLTANETQLTFSVALTENLKDAQSRVSTRMKYGNGFREDVAYIEREGQIFDGTTTVNAMFRDELGRQVDYANSTLAYDYFHLDFMKRFESKALKNSEDTQESHLLIAAPIVTNPGAGSGYVAAAASPIAVLRTVLGI